MPAITRTPKDLYVAKSVGELNKLANDKVTMIMKASSPDLLLNSMKKVFNQAKQSYDCGDEERAFIFYMRVAILCQAVNASRYRDDKKFAEMFKEAIVKCEELSTKLGERYEQATSKSVPSSSTLPTPGKTIKANDTDTTNINNVNPAKTTNNINNNGFKNDLSFANRRDGYSSNQIDGDNVIYPSIEPLEMYDLIEDLVKTGSNDIILLLDARKREDFEASHLSNLKTDKVKLLNIPEELLEKGTAATKLLKSLPNNAQLILKERRTARKVIIFDWKSSSYSENERLAALFDALWKWDNKEGCPSPPILLKKGYYGWLNSYPMLTSNSKVTPPVSDDSNDSEYESLCLNFYSQLNKAGDSSPDVPKPAQNGTSYPSLLNDGEVVDNDDTGMIQDSNELVIRLTNSKLKDNANKIPGTAQPVPPINRQVKPKLNNGDANSPLKSPNMVNKNDKPNGLSPSTMNATATIPVLSNKPLNISTQQNGNINENNNIVELEFKARKSLEAQEEMIRLMESEYETASLEKDKILKKIQADREHLLRENVDLKRKLKPNPSKLPDPSSDSSTIISSVAESREPFKPVKFSVAAESGDESENEREATSNPDEEMCYPATKPIMETTIKRSDERTVSESSSPSAVPRIPSIAKTGKSLSRSYSSPNIADHYDDEDSQNRPPSNHQPTFDRALKPLSNATDFPRGFTSSARMRNFSPIYGIPGQVNTGLKNLGNTCFMNAVLQCLADTSIFRRYFLQEKHMADISRHNRLGSRGELAEELGALIREIRSNQYKSVSPSNFKDAVGTHMPFFMGCEQQDAHEFLCMLLEKLHADLNRAPTANGALNLPDDLPPHIAITKFWNHHISRNRSIVSEMFEGLLMSTLKCTACGKQSHTFEVFSNLSLPIPTKLGHRFTILDCLDLFSDEEKLFGEAAWECPTCKVKRDAIKQIKICKLPKVLVIHLKRFSYEGKWRQKLQNMVDFPLFDLKLKKYKSCSSLDNFDASYELYGVVNHYGTLEGGHYVAFCKNDEKNKWFKYDDHEVTELSTADVKSHAAYLLFYTSNN